MVVSASDGCGQSRAGSCNFPSARNFDIRVLMARQETLISKKRRGPAPTGQGTPIMVRLNPEQLAAVDAWAVKQDDEPSRPEAIRRLVAKALEL